MKSLNVIGDVAGNYKTLIALLAKMPSGVPVSLGDMNDRGPRSKEVIQFFKDNGRAIHSNHGHMFVDFYKRHTKDKIKMPYYDANVFLNNGGFSTLYSYSINKLENNTLTMCKDVLEDHIDYLEQLPLFIKTKDYFLSHGPFAPFVDLRQAVTLGEGFLVGDYSSEFNLLWNRRVPERPNPNLYGKINIFGHNGADHVKLYSAEFQKGIYIKDNNQLNRQLNKGNVHAICIDTCRRKVLTGIHIPSMVMYEQEYID